MNSCGLRSARRFRQGPAFGGFVIAAVGLFFQAPALKTQMPINRLLR